MKTGILGQLSIAFDYNQFLVYDISVESPECEWTEKHCSQGFARRQSTVCVGTILQYGQARIAVVLGPFVEKQGYERVIAVPFFSPTGKIIIGGLMEIYIAHVVFCPRGHYKLYVAQSVSDGSDDVEDIDVFFSPQEVPCQRSEVLIADEGLEPPEPLLEDAGTLAN